MELPPRFYLKQYLKAVFPTLSKTHMIDVGTQNIFIIGCMCLISLLFVFSSYNVTFTDLSARVDAVKEENLKLKSENQVLGQYIENLMSASSVFQTTDTKSKRK